MDNLLEMFHAEGSTQYLGCKDITSESLEEIANNLNGYQEQMRK